MGDSMPQRFIAAWNSHDAATVVAMYAVDGSHEDLGIGVVAKGHDAIRAFAIEGGADFQLSLVSEQTGQDRYAIEWVAVGTHTAEMGGVPATNKPFRFRGASIGHLDAEGKIIENRDYFNLADLLMQIGLLPPLGT